MVPVFAVKKTVHSLEYLEKVAEIFLFAKKFEGTDR